ncbi:DUF1800 domain-containing protein [Angustibacter luteus]|uniref:DUF1800 domain-containing protein n=1 Tax=Angustibacter luteus TaxID=658456 RepID=A0ABW1JAR4_9ACTN
MTDDVVLELDQNPVGRRALLLAVAGAGAAASAVGTLATAAPAQAAPPTTGSYYVNRTQATLLAQRTTGGATPALVASITRLGAAKWLDYQLNPARLNDATFERIATRFAKQSMPIWQVRSLLEEGGLKGWEHKFQIQCEHVARLCWSSRQLQAVMTDFWTNHLNVAVMSDGVDESRAHYQYTIRTKALGKYSDLLLAASQHPAMLTFLDNRSSRKAHPNENQGRELLELHTLGVGNYTETDVLNSTRVLTGLSVENESGEFEYKPWYHWTGAVKVLGWKSVNNSRPAGLAVARSMLTYLAHHPATARRVCTKLAQYFVAETPPPALVSRMVTTYLKNDTAIAPVLRMMFLSAEFRASWGAVTRRPLEATVANVRSLGLGIDATGYEGVKALVYAMGEAGQSPMNWPTPDGYPLASAAWGSTSATLERWNFTRSLTAGWWPTTLTRPNLLTFVHPAALPTTHGPLVDAVATKLFGRTLAAADRTAVLTFLGVTATSPLRADSAAVTWRLAEWVSLLLDSPYQLYR